MMDTVQFFHFIGGFAGGILLGATFVHWLASYMDKKDLAERAFKQAILYALIAITCYLRVLIG